jgi:hypothetical protein
MPSSSKLKAEILRDGLTTEIVRAADSPIQRLLMKWKGLAALGNPA